MLMSVQLVTFCFLFCRAEGILNRGNVDAFALEESQNLSIFFATNNSITQYLKKSLEEVGILGNENPISVCVCVCVCMWYICMYAHIHTYRLPHVPHVVGNHHVGRVKPINEKPCLHVWPCRGAILT